MVTPKKIIRSICLFTSSPAGSSFDDLQSFRKHLISRSFEVQTLRLCSPALIKIMEMDKSYSGKGYIFGVGSLTTETINKYLSRLLAGSETHWNLDLTVKEIENEDIQILFKIIKNNPQKTFNFAYVFNNRSSSPFFPSANYLDEGFSIGLQSTDLSLGCNSLHEWLENQKSAWQEINDLFTSDSRFLGIDSSVAPLVTDSGSFIGFIKRLGLNFSQTVTTDFYLTITDFIKKNNPKPIGLCGLMFPCLEDAELANEYENGNFAIERNIYLSLHSGLGIDTYPIGIDENPQRVLEILKLLQKLSNKYTKPLSCRFVSDGKTRIGGKSDFQNQYLKDVVIRKL
ncbi:hypothetical protein A3J20_00480 [Candidatus Gottesmanbacteria bacterium RIFCSPLOWO2_02_FULL_42_29]|uniref:DUF711 domain-containing protein n=2 Tax=Candidatus Gottesmaniibacteriota TaxID=1752720 RepID=A0A1F6BAP8_9BACT|nr:MAG: hypothetical protein UV09_C0035G0002 [Candidatus Gottesmanbacteria bacterium GW2011_GWA2_42_18]KKS74629.1 MAG: hypothetical protein UV46_C0039G0011 [Candidatus Gottesmanbacteria bacterium GW2011_GWC2_42_8]OGG09637.1 MAG: hypothetical protein A2781_02770 [Candidatus Gottesmanbacteria bacterium RIFCSPHIGHO2_01_FULL_42_27]OGG19583.1 MAG: hypothetical protein A3E72_05645 [Candidatus Gottesmanbacteria bacterium RIFCSPHIGHO2_12_FULL_43_26]OGG33803.1 MAG: hypothetical protein A3G68_04185 [Cand